MAIAIYSWSEPIILNNEIKLTITTIVIDFGSDQLAF